MLLDKKGFCVKGYALTIIKERINSGKLIPTSVYNTDRKCKGEITSFAELNSMEINDDFFFTRDAKLRYEAALKKMKANAQEPLKKLL